MAVDSDGTLLNVIETGQQTDNRTFSGACRTNQRDGFARFRAEIQVFQHVYTLFVSKRDVAELHAALHLRKRRRAFVVVDGNRFIKHLENAFEVCSGVDQVVIQVAQHLNRHPETEHITDKG